jgi:ankyrin repeat protein
MKKYYILKYFILFLFFSILFYFYIQNGFFNRNLNSILGVIQSNDLEKIKKNLKKIKKIDYLPTGEIIITYALKNCNYETIDFLIKNGFDINKKDKNGLSPLDICWERGDRLLLNKLNESGVFLSDILINIENISDKELKLNQLSKFNDIFNYDYIIKNLIKEYNYLYRLNENFIKKNETYFYIYKYFDKTISENEIIKKLSNEEFKLLKELDKKLYVISKYLYQYLNIIKYMVNRDWYNIKNDLDINKYSKYILSYLLRVSMNLELINSFDYILNLGADPLLIGFGPDGTDTFSIYNNSLLISIAKKNGYYFKKLFSYFNIDKLNYIIYDKNNNRLNFLNPIILCADLFFNEAVYYIIEKDKSKLNLINNKGESLLIYSILIDNYDLQYYLVKNGANITLAIDYDNSNKNILPIHFAIIKNNFGILKAILDAYRKNEVNFPEIKAICMYNGQTFTALSLASYLKRDDIFKYLLSLNIDNNLGLFDSIKFFFENENYNLIRYLFLNGYFKKLKYEEQQYFINLAKNLNKEYLFQLPKEEN